MERGEGAGPSVLTDIVRLHLSDFQMEIRTMLDEIDLSLVNLEAEPAGREHLIDLYERFHAIGGLFGLMQERLGQRLAFVSEELVEAIRKYRTVADPQGINQLLQAARFLRRMASDATVAEDSRFTGEVGQHILAMRQVRADLMLEVRQPLEHETRIGEILIREGAMDAADVAAVLSRQQESFGKAKFGELLLREKRVEASDVIRAIRMQKLRAASVSEPTVTIPLARMEEVLALVDALLLRSNGIQGEAMLRFGSKDRFSVESTELTGQLVDMKRVLSAMRLVSLQTVYSRLTKTFDSLMEETCRSIRLTTVGEAVEVHKELSDRLLSPLADLLTLFLELTAPLEGEESLDIVEVVAYREMDGLHMDVTGNARVPSDQMLSHAGWARITSSLLRLGGTIVADDLRGTCIRARLVFPEQEEKG